MNKENALILAVLLISITPLVGQTVSHEPDTCEIIYDSVLNRSYYTYTDKAPAYRGGPRAMIKVINRNLKWPGGRCDVEGNVFVFCIIESDGKLTNKKILKGLNNSNGCNADNEALDVLDFLTKWTPGECGGQKVPALYVIPVKFKITND